MANVLSINGAGGSATNSILALLPIDLVAGAESADISQGVQAYVDAGEGFPGQNSVTAGLTPSATTYTPSGLTGSYVASTRILTVTNVGTVAAGMYIGLSQGATKTFARIEQVVSSTQLKLASAPFGGDTTNIAYQVWWAYKTTASGSGSAVTSNAAGKLNVFKFQGADSLGNIGNNTPGLSFYVRDAPTNLLVINGGTWTGQRIASVTPTFDMLPDWPSRGGIASLELVSSSGLAWWDGSVAEKGVTSIFAQPAQSRLLITGGDGLKTATLRARTTVGATRFANIANISLEYDASAPVVSAYVTTSN